MPANRSRTERWRDSLWKIYERGGGLEFAVDHGSATSELKDLVWRVRILGLSDDEIRVELPGALGRSFRIDPGTALVGIMSVGQNRWMFHTEVLSVVDDARQGTGRALRLRMPEVVERCMRRTFDRISTAELHLPPVECWPLRNPRSALPAEVASRVRLLDLLDADLLGAPQAPGPDLMPDVGPKFGAKLANLGGGGVGLLLEHDAGPVLDGGPLFWLRIDLAPVLPAPLAMTARLAHTHLDSQQRVYAGMAFDFSYNPAHQHFIIDQMDRYLTSLQVRRVA